MSNAAPRRLGDFEIVRELGRGGMGVVYEARQVSLNRKVALKVLSGGLGLTPKAVQRFHREAEAAAKLHHTNIVPVYATGDEDGTHFYAMELIDGPSLDHVIRQLKASRERHSAVRGSPDPAPGPTAGLPEPPGDLRSGDAAGSGDPRRAQSHSPHLEATGPYAGESSPSQALSSSSLSSGSHYFDTVARMIADVADALQHAHQNGVIHRDIKPSNLLLSPAGRLSVNDFGLARMLEQPGMTMTGEFVGTPAYMSPEQITAGRIPLDHRTDIYSLGATLYELLTLGPPFRGQSREQVLGQIVQKEPKAPRRIDKRVPVDLETICLKCLEKDPDRRYQTAAALAEDLRRYVNRFAISARRAGPGQRLVKWVRRRPAVAASLGCVLLAVSAALAFAYWAYHEKQQRIVEQEQAEERLHEEQARARLQILNEKISKAYVVATSGDLDKTDEAIKEIEELGGSTGQVRLLQGMVYYFRFEMQRAIGELEQAVKLLPESVTALALLAVSYKNRGQFERAGQLSDAMESLSPTSPEDYLFKGHAREQISGLDGLANINEGIRQRDSPLGRVLRARARANRAYDAGNREEAEEAVRDADAARRTIPESPEVILVSISSRVIAAMIYQETKLPEKRAAMLNEAEREVRALERFRDDLPPGLFWIVWYFYEQTGDRAKALAVAQRALAKSGDLGAAKWCAIDLYHLDRLEEALQCLNQRRQNDLLGDITRTLVLAELPDGPRRVLEEYKKSARDLPESALCAWKDVLLLLGEKKQADAICQSRPKPDRNLPREQNEFADAEWQFARGVLSEDQYLAKAGNSRRRQSAAHYHIGLFRLSAGDRDGAREHFQKGARPSWGDSVLWCQMFLSRMDKVKDWPPWITHKK